MKKNLGYIVLAVSGSIYIGYFFIVTLFLLGISPNDSLDIGRAAIAEVTVFIPIAILFLTILKLSQKKEKLFEKITLQSVLAHLAILLMFMVSHSLWQIYFNSFLLPGATFNTSVFIRDILGFLNIRVLVYLITIGLVIGIKRIQEKENFELKESELKLKLQQAKIRRYELKLNPDIIYPTLSYVKENAGKKPEKASQLILNVSKQMRILIDHLNEENIPVKEDLYFFKYYFRSLSIRLNRPIKIQTKVDDKHLDMKIPSLILLVPFFEKLFLGDYSNYTEGIEEVNYSSGHTTPEFMELSIEMYPVRDIMDLKRKLRDDEHLLGLRDLLKYYENSSLEAVLAIHTLAIHLTIPSISTQKEYV